MMPDNLSPTLLTRYLSGEATDAERAEVEAWAQTPANRRELDRLRAVWSPAAGAHWNVEDAWQRVAARLEAPAVVAIREPRRWAVLPLALAAAVVLALGAALIWRGTRAGAPAGIGVVTAAAGERRAVDLPDGTHVILAPGSELRVADDFGRDSRRVDLLGEAWFVVEHDAARPFMVHAAGTITEDLGTEFLVQELPSGTGVRVALVSGSASLRHEGDTAAEAVTLSPNDIGWLAPADPAARVEHGADLRALVAWPQGRLEFEDAPLSDVAAAITRWYAVPVVLDGTGLAARRFTGTLRLDSLEDAIEVLRLSLGVQSERRADTLVVR